MKKKKKKNGPPPPIALEEQTDAVGGSCLSAAPKGAVQNVFWVQGTPLRPPQTPKNFLGPLKPPETCLHPENPLPAFSGPAQKPSFLLSCPRTQAFTVQP